MDSWLLNAERVREWDDCYRYDYSLFNTWAPGGDEDEDEEEDVW